MGDPSIEGLIGHQAQLQQQFDRLSQEVLTVAVAVTALSIALILLTVKLAMDGPGE